MRKAFDVIADVTGIKVIKKPFTYSETPTSLSRSSITVIVDTEGDDRVLLDGSTATRARNRSGLFFMTLAHKPIEFNILFSAYIFV